MLIKNTRHRFGIMAISLHWIMAFLLIGLVCMGLYMSDLPVSAQKLKLYRWHKEFGLLALMLVIVRLTWRLTNITPSLGHLPKWEALGARAAHYAFYFFMFAQPISGWLLTSAAGLAPSFFGLVVFPNLIAADKAHRLFFAGVHEWLGYALIATFCVHVGAALKHYFIDKDDILQRMIKP